MRRKTTIAGSILLTVLLSGTVALAQQPGYVRVTTIHVQLGHQQHYESLIPKVWDALRKAGGKDPILVTSGVSDPSAYTFVIPMMSFADVDAQEKALQQAFSSVPDVTAELVGITNSVDDEIWAARPDLSYTASSPRLGMQEQAFTRIALLYPYPAQAQAFEAVLQERSALRKKHGADSVDVVQLVVGRDGPAYAVLIGAKDEVDYHTQAAKEQQKMGAEWRASIDKSGPMLRRVEFVTGLARPELYYQP